MNTNIVYIVDKVWQSWQNNSLRRVIVSNHFWATLYHNELWSHLYFMIYVWKELSKCLDDILSKCLVGDKTTSTLSSCTCSFEGQATLNEYVRCGLYSRK
jgi:hypothetical protein